MSQKDLNNLFALGEGFNAAAEFKRIKAVSVDLLETLKAEKLRTNHWRDKEFTRDAVRLAIQDYL